MAKHLFLLKLQVKAAFCSIPQILGGTVIFTMLLFLLGFASNKLLLDAPDAEQMNIGLVLPKEDNPYTQLLFSYVEEVDTVKSMCTFHAADRETALNNLDNGSFFSVILIPDRFMDSLIGGFPTPVTILLAKSGRNSSSAFFRQLLQAGADDFGACEAGIYAMGDFLRTFAKNENIGSREDQLGRVFMSYLLDRAVYFDHLSLTPAGDLSMGAFYLCAGVVMLLLLSGITCMDFLKRDAFALTLSLRREGVPPGILPLYKLAGISLMFYALLAGAYPVAWLVSIRFPQVVPPSVFPGPASLACLFVLTASVFSFVIFIFQLADNPALGAIALFFLSALFLFVSGGIIPLSLLPDGLKAIAPVVPSFAWLKFMQQIYSASTTPGLLLACLGWCCLFGFLSALVSRLKCRI